MLVHKEYVNNAQYIACLIDDLGGSPYFISRTVVRFQFKGNYTQYFVKSKWLTGKGVIDGRGIEHLQKQLRNG